MKVGLIGAGRIGAIHADNLSRHPDVSAILITDVFPAQSERVASAIGGTVVTGTNELLESVDAVVICTPADMHVEEIELREFLNRIQCRWRAPAKVQLCEPRKFA